MLISLADYEIWDKSHINNIPIIITTYHRGEALIKCLSTMTQNLNRNIYIIDNSCGKIDHILNELPNKKFTVIKNSQNIGKAASIQNNLHIIKNTNWFISMDPDLIISSYSLEKFINNTIEISSTYPVALSAPLINRDINKNQVKVKKLDMHVYDNMLEIKPDIFINNKLAGCMLMINTNFFIGSGGFTKLRIYGEDDGELCNKAKKNDMCCIIDANINCLHYRDDEPEEYINWKINNVKGSTINRGYWG